jgi:signal transduction histidine kinase
LEPTSSVLLVEDEEDHAELIRRAFESPNHHRFRLTVAGSLWEARESLNREQPDIVLADLKLPDGLGIELLPPEGQPQTFPVVVLTSQGDEQAAVEAMKAGALDYVAKSPSVFRDIPRLAERALREWQHIIERQRAEEERRKLEIRLQHSQRLESLGILAGGIAHDFNNLVMAIMGHARLALADLEEDEPAHECVADIESAAIHASELCRQLLAYSGRNRFVVEAIDLNRLVSEMTQLLEAAISKLAVLELEPAEDLPAVEGAATQIRQIVMNLIMNASDALGGKKGRITVRTGTVEADREVLDAAYLNEDLPPGRYVYVEVEDTGCGMDEATKKKLFDPFFTTKSSGRGLGMAAVQGILRSHKGALQLVTQPGRGTKFRILFPASDLPLPVEAAAEAPAAGVPQAPKRRGGAATVLIVDDDITIRAVTTIALEGAGYLVIAAADGREGIEKYRRHKDEIAAVLLDLNMPELSGDEAFRELRELGAEVPVIISSGSAEEEVAELVPGLAGFVQKPYKAEALIAKMRQVLHG